VKDFFHIFVGSVELKGAERQNGTSEGFSIGRLAVADLFIRVVFQGMLVSCCRSAALFSRWIFFQDGMGMCLSDG